jgi:hypothetical protein
MIDSWFGFMVDKLCGMDKNRGDHVENNAINLNNV